MLSCLVHRFMVRLLSDGSSGLPYLGEDSLGDLRLQILACERYVGRGRKVKGGRGRAVNILNSFWSAQYYTGPKIPGTPKRVDNFDSLP